jgi:hypothetical protein
MIGAVRGAVFSFFFFTFLYFLTLQKQKTPENQGF